MERPGVVWAFTILVSLGILSNFFIGLGLMFTPSIVNLIAGIIVFLTLIPPTIMIVKFFNLKKSAKLWVHIAFSLSILYNLVNLIFSLTSLFERGIVLPIISIIVSIVFWIVIVDYINKKTIDNQPVFT